jgi:hypothetical protein
MKIYDIINEDGVIVPGVNTTVDVKPGETERQAAKFGNGKIKELMPKARKNSKPNTLFNMGLTESATTLMVKDGKTARIENQFVEEYKIRGWKIATRKDIK